MMLTMIIITTFTNRIIFSGYLLCGNLFRQLLPKNLLPQEPISRSMQLRYISVKVFSLTDLFLDRISLEWGFRGSAMTNHKKLIDITESLDRNCLSSTKETIY